MHLAHMVSRHMVCFIRQYKSFPLNLCHWIFIIPCGNNTRVVLTDIYIYMCIKYICDYYSAYWI